MPFAEPGVKPHYAPDRAVRITHIDVVLSVEPELATFSGTARLSITPLACYAGRFAFDLDDVELLDVTDGSGALLPHRYGDGQVEITATTVPTVVVVRWKGASPTRGIFFTGPTEELPNRAHMMWTQCQDEDGHFVFPCHDHPGIKHPWSLELSAPIGYTLLSNGTEGEKGVRNGRAFARFSVADPMPAYLVSFVAAKLTQVDAASVDGKPVRYFVPVGSEANVERSFGRTPSMITHLQDRLGVAYPWARYDQVVVHDFIFGGMENVGCTTMAEVLLVDSKADLEWNPDALVVHELAHQWFGDLVTCQDWSQGWLNESWATYIEAVWWEHTKSVEETIWYRHQTAAGYHTEASGRYRRPIVSYDFREPIDVFDRHLYNKGSCVLWTLRHELGDGPFWGAVNAYVTAHAHGTVHTRDFQRALEAHTGRNLDGFFHQWIHRAGHPILDVKLGKAEGLVTVTVRQTQSGDDVEEAFRVLLRVEVVCDDGSVQSIDLPIAERERTWALPASNVKTVRVDPGYRMLAEITLSGPESWLSELVCDPCPVLATRAAAGLIADGSANALRAVRSAATAHPFGPVRGTIAQALSQRGTQSDRDVAIAMLQSDVDPRARRMAAEALGSFRDATAANALLQELASELPTWQLHGAVLNALGKTRDPRAVAELHNHLDTPSWADLVRQKALAGLAATQEASTMPVLVERSRRGSSRARAAAAQGIAALAEVHHELIRPATERLVEMVQEPGFRTQIIAIGALGSLGDPAGIPALSRLHQSAPDGRVRRTAYEALVKIRAGVKPGSASQQVQRRMDKLSEENSALRERLDKLEAGVPSAKG